MFQPELLETSTFPQKIYVELTTRCNLHCKMCVKYAEGSEIVEEDLPFSVFEKLAPSLAQAKTLVLNGIGEPMLHPDLVEIIRLARKCMPRNATIGFQSNGYLLDEKKSLDLVAAGLSTICLSLDSLEQGSSGKGEHSFAAVCRAIETLTAAKHRHAADYLQIGLETVLTMNNIRHLPQLIQWAGDNGVDFVIATHLMNYDQATEGSGLFNPNPAEAVQLFNAYSDRAAALGIDPADSLASYLKFTKTADDQKAHQFFLDLHQEARSRDIQLHLPSLLEHANTATHGIEQIFSECRVLAEHSGLTLLLPENEALSPRKCLFIRDSAVFIAASGSVMPCHFLWHTYSCRMFGENIHVPKRTFGNIVETPLETIWCHPEYRQFRAEAGLYDYAPCWTCIMGPCAALVKDREFFANDCYGSQVPCGHCQWSLGGLRCL